MKTVQFLILLILILGIQSCTKHTNIPAYLAHQKKAYNKDPRGTNLEWFREAKYGMFIHYGLYSLLEKGEWVQLRDTIPVVEYAKLKETFTAEHFDAEMITDLAINAG